MTYIISDLSKYYFDKYDRSNEGDHVAIIWEFRRNRARAQVLNEYIFMVANTLKELGIKY
jgi:acyl-coenzyme A synthetase/AMP-(fatty) acid ligase